MGNSADHGPGRPALRPDGAGDGAGAGGQVAADPEWARPGDAPETEHALSGHAGYYER